MKILCVNCIISEFGGVEFAAMNLARGLAVRGHEVHFLGALGAQPQLRPKGFGESETAISGDQLRLHYGKFPRIYPLGEKRDGVTKLIWHLQDLLHPSNERIFENYLHQIRPDIVLLHNITAVGLNIWRSLTRTKTPSVQVIHDLSLACMNMSRFRGGKACEGVCRACALYKAVRFSMIDKNSRFSFVAPSRGILRATERYVDLSPWPQAVIPNTNTFEVHPRRTALSPPELLYVGRLDPSKGVSMMLAAASQARRNVEFRLHVLGSGSQEEELRNAYAGQDWVTFHGSVSQTRVAEFMSCARLLLIPSLWEETVPGVAVHALYAGLPAMGSRIGGIPEHIIEGKTGFLLPPGDIEAWRQGIENALSYPAALDAFEAESPRQAQRFDAELAISAYERFMLDRLDDKHPSVS